MYKFLGIITLLVTSNIWAGQFQMIEGSEALQVYHSLKGKKCIEYQTAYQIVFSRSDSLNCVDGNSANEWQCTVQYEKNQKNFILQSASCIREQE